MKKRKSHTRRSVSILLCAAVLIAAFVAVYNIKMKPEQDSEKYAGENGKSIVQTANLISFDTELVNVGCIGETAKIDLITPGLDIYSMRVAIYDLKTDKLLSETNFPEGDWITGQTENGFYVVEKSEKTLQIYDKAGKLKYEKTFSDKEVWSPVCGVSEDEKYFIYTAAFNGDVYVYNLQNNTKKKLADKTAFRESLGFHNGVLYAAGIDGAVFAIDIADSSVLTEVYNDKRLNTYSPFYSLGTTEYNFIAASGSGVKYIPFGATDELAVGIGKQGFTTAVSGESGDRLRIYNLKNKTVAEANVNDTVESVCYTNNDGLLIVTGDASSKKHSIYFCDLEALHTSPLTVNDFDIPEKTEPKINIPEADMSEKARVIEGVPVLSQFPDFPTGCESLSAVMVLKYFEENISADDFIDKYLPKSTKFYYEWGKKYGPSPYEYFIGNPRTAASYGCMAPVIEKAFCQYFGNSERVKNTTGAELAQLCEDYIDNDIPVMVWATINMLEINPKNSWYLSNGKRFTWPGNEHCLVLTGYDSNSYYFNDPYAGKTVKYEKKTVNQRYIELGRQSLVVLTE